MHIQENNKIPLYQFDIFNPFKNQINHFISTRNEKLPPSKNNFFTVGLNGAIDNKHVLKNRENIAHQLGIETNNFVFAMQVHQSHVAVIKEIDKGKGAFDRSTSLHDTDAMITNHPGICLVTQAADCVPILFYDPVKNAIGVAHAGWKGTILKITSEVVLKMGKEFGTNPRDLLVGIGPSIGPCCYEVGEDVIESVRVSFGSIKGLIVKNEKFTNPIFNLWEANILTLTDCGVTPENIETARLCTRCNNNLFFSARSGDQGRVGGGMMLRV